MLACWMLAIWAAMHVARETPVGRLMRRVLVEAPARQLSKLSRGDVILMTIVLLGGGAMLLVLDAELIRFAGLMMPEMAAWAAVFDIGTLIDLFAVSLWASSTVRVRTIAAQVSARFTRRSGRAARTRKRVRRDRPAANDDEEGGALPLAA